MDATVSETIPTLTIDILSFNVYTSITRPAVPVHPSDTCVKTRAVLNVQYRYPENTSSDKD